MIFEVFIPASGDGGYDTTYQIDADNWRRALITGIRQTTLNFTGLEGCAVEIGEDETTVMHPGLKLTFRVKKLPDAKGSAKVIQAAVTGAFAAIPSRPPTDKLQIPQGGKPAGFKDKNTGTFRAIGAATGRAVVAPAPILDGEAGGPVRILSESNRPTGSKHEILKPDLSPTATVDENAALEDAFLELPALFERNMAIEDGIDFIADLTARLIPSANTSVFFASDGGGTAAADRASRRCSTTPSRWTAVLLRSPFRAVASSASSSRPRMSVTRRRSTSSSVSLSSRSSSHPSRRASGPSA